MYATANKDDPVDDVAWAIMREISRMCYSPVEEDIIRAKNQLKAAILFSQDNLNGELRLLLGMGSLWLASCGGSMLFQLEAAMLHGHVNRNDEHC